MNNVMWMGAVAFAVCGALGPVVIPLLHKLRFGQSVRGCGPESHKQKSGTPTMGGVMILMGLMVAVAIFGEFTPALKATLFLTLSHGVIGALDDGIKIVRKRNLGLNVKQKFALQILVAAGFIWYGVTTKFPTELWVPGFNIYFDLGWGYYLIVLALLLGTTNAVNFTDGLDGLVSLVSLPVFLTFGFFAYTIGKTDLMGFSAALFGSLLGFLIYNRHPAKVFMGDTGSLALGGAVAALALLLKCELLLIVLGGIYVAEALSVILQVGSFKLRHGKRIFRMAPIHHHFELGGWGEVLTVKVFSLVSCLLAAVSFGLWVLKFVI